MGTKMQVLILENRLLDGEEAYKKVAIDQLKQELKSKNVQFVCSERVDDATAILRSNYAVDCMLMAKTSAESSAWDAEALVALVDTLHQHQPNVPIFLLADRAIINQTFDMQLATRINEFLIILEDSSEFIVGRMLFAMDRYQQGLMPPLTDALKSYHRTYEYSWDVPGHQGGVGFRKTPAGRRFHDFYGQNLFGTDINRLGLSLGSLLSHSGAFSQSEANIARIFGADISYSGVVGTSGSNRTVMQYCIQDGDTVVVDRNCHKSITHGMILTAAKPVYMKPSRNQYGIIGPVGVAEIRKAMAAATNPVYSVITNCTYDGICYNSARIEQEMKDVPYVHLDEAWYAYARFNPLYKGMYAMRGDPKEDADTRQPTIFVTQSSHKMLNALTMASYIHVRSGKKRALDAVKFNEAYMMHTTTSPSTIIAASNDVAAHMMDGQTGQLLTQEAIDEAVAFRQTLARLHTHHSSKAGGKDWFFKPWNIDAYEGVPFEKLPLQQLATQQRYWMLRPGDTWHGYTDLVDEDWAMLDPVKVSILTPGMNADGTLGPDGVPAQLVNAWLVHYGIISARQTDFQVMFFFSMGITRGKWATLLKTLYSFKSHYDANTPIRDILPELNANTDKYQDMGLRDLGEEMFEYLKRSKLTALLNDAFENLPEMAMTPRKGNQALISNSERVKLKDVAHRVVSTAILPYPPGIPMLISGERFGKSAAECPHMKYLLALEEWDRTFPGFAHETVGVQVDGEGNYEVLCQVEKNY